MAESWKILVPTAEIKKPSITVPSIPDLNGKVVGFVSNESWKCLVPIWKKLAEVLRAKYGITETFKVAVPMTNRAPAQVLDEVATRGDAAVVALAG